MAEIAELTRRGRLRELVDELRTCVGHLGREYGDIPAIKRLAGDVERLDVDAADLNTAAPIPGAGEAARTLTPLTDEPLDPALWADADDEGLGGYHRDASDARGTGR